MIGRRADRAYAKPTPIPEPTRPGGQVAAPTPTPETVVPTGRVARPFIRPRKPPQPKAPVATTLSNRIARAAKHYLSSRPPASFRNDCSGFVCAVLDRAGVPAAGNTASLWDQARGIQAVHHRKRPLDGDLVFFDDTWDRNGNGRLDDPLTHIGVVTTVDADGTAHVAHVSSSKGRTTLFLNLQRVHDHKDDNGKVLNSFLRAKTSKDGPGVRYLAGELVKGFATVSAEDLESWSR